MSEDVPISARAPIAAGDLDMLAEAGKVETATHHGSLVGEIAVVAPDGKKRVPFSVAVTATEVVTFSYLPDGSSVIDRFVDGKHAGTLATFSSSRIKLPAGLAFDGARNLFIPDADRGCIVKCDARGDVVAELGSEGTGEGELMGPRDVDLGPDGKIVIADAENHRVQVWSAAGEPIACWGAEASEDDESKFLPSGRGDGEFFRPLGVTWDKDGRVWVADTNNHRIQCLSERRGFELAFGSEGDAAGDLKFPIDVRIDARGLVVVADQGGKRIQWFTQQGKLESAMNALEAIPEGASVVDVDVDEAGDVFIPVGPLGRVYRVRKGAHV